MLYAVCFIVLMWSLWKIYDYRKRTEKEEAERKERLRAEAMTPVGPWEGYFFDCEWMVYNRKDTSWTCRFMRNGLLLIHHEGKERIEKWRLTEDGNMEISALGMTEVYALVQMNRNIVVMQEKETEEYMVLIEPEYQKVNRIYSIKQIDKFVRNGENMPFILPFMLALPMINDWAGLWKDAEETEAIVNVPTEGVDEEYEEDVYDGDYPEEFSEYADLTEEEIIYDYLEEEEDAES